MFYASRQRSPTFGIVCALVTGMSPSQLAPTARIVRPRAAAPAPSVRTALTAAEADRLIRAWLHEDVRRIRHADTERNPTLEA